MVAVCASPNVGRFEARILVGGSAGSRTATARGPAFLASERILGRSRRSLLLQPNAPKSTTKPINDHARGWASLVSKIITILTYTDGFEVANRRVGRESLRCNTTANAINPTPIHCE